MTLLDVRNLRVAIGAAHAVDGISFQIEAGETFCLLGESGCGKSMTALALMRLLPAAARIDGGEVRLAGQELLALTEAQMRSLRGATMAMIFQEPATSLNPVLSIGKQIGEAVACHQALPAAALRARSIELLHTVGMPDAARRCDEYPFQLSGGMKQRAMIAMALAAAPKLLVADEPTTALDVTIQAQVLDLLKQLQRERGMGMLLITHDLGVVARMADRIGVMYAGELVEVASREEFFSNPRHPYSRRLFAALPDAAARERALLTIPGNVPPLGEWGSACRFAPRCAEAMALCRQVAPQLRDGVRCHLYAQAAAPNFSAPLHGDANVMPAAAVGAEPLLRVRDLRLHFPIRRGLLQRTVGHVRAVDGVSFDLFPGRTLALVGESGCGKTTVGKSILQLLPVSAGSVRLGEWELVGLRPRQLRPLRARMQMVFQDPFASLNPRLRVGDIIAEGMHAVGMEGERVQAVAALLQQVGLSPAMAGRYPHAFSGGQRQRIAIARALAVRPQVLICDEPTSALDVSVQAQILNLLRELQTALGLAYLFITHNIGVVRYLADEVAVMYLGRIVEQGDAAQVLHNPLHPYTRALLAAVPRIEAPTAPPPLGGDMPSPAAPPAGCHFHPRCAHALPVCRERYPAWHGDDGHRVRCHLHVGAAGL